MLESSPLLNGVAVAVVSGTLIALGFFLTKTLIASNQFEKGRTLYSQKDYPGAETAFREVLKRHPSNDVVRLLLGDTLIQQDKLDAAIAELKDLTQRSPNNLDAYLKLAEALLKQGFPNEAIATLSQAQNLRKLKDQERSYIQELLQGIEQAQNK